MKKPLSALIAVCIVFQALAPNLFRAYADMPATVLYYEFFDGGWEDGLMPGTIKTTGVDDLNTVSNILESVPDTENPQGYLNITAQKGFPQTQFNYGTSTAQSNISFKIKVERISSDIVLWLNSKNGKGKLLTFTTGLSVTAADGNSQLNVGNFEPGSWHEIGLHAEVKEGVYQLYIDGALCAENFRLPLSSSLRKPLSWKNGYTGFIFDTYNLSDSVTSFCLDDVAVYTGGEILNKDGITAVLEAVDEEDGDLLVNILESANFNEDETGGNVSVSNEAKGNNIKVADFPDSDNKSARLSSVSEDDMLVNYVFPDNYQDAFIMEFDIYFNDLSRGRNITLRDPSPYFFYPIRFNTNGTITASGVNPIRYTANQWYKITIIMNLPEHLYTVKVNGEILVENGVVPEGLKSLGLVRLQVESGNDNSTCYLDNWRIYEATEPMSDEYFESISSIKASPFTSMTKTASVFKNTVAFADGGSYLYAGGTRKRLASENADIRSKDEDGTMMVPLRSLTEALKGNLEYIDETETAKVTIDGKTLEYTANSDKAVVNGETVTLAAVPGITRDKFYVGIDDFASMMQIRLAEYDKLSVLLLGEKEIDLEKQKDYVAEMTRYLTYTRPSAQTVQSTFENRNPAHPYIMADRDTFERIKEQMKTDPTVQAWMDKIRVTADNLMAQPPVEYVLPDGLRLLDTSRNVLSKAKTLGLMYNVTGDEKYAEALWKNIEAAGNFSDWNSHRHYLDTSEMTAAFGIAYDWLYDYWTADQKKFIEQNIIDKSLKITSQSYQVKDTSTKGFWITCDYNWNIVCNGGAVVGALAIGHENPELMGEIVSNALHSAEYMLPEFGPDGGWTEGPGYWQYTVQYLSLFMGSLDYALGTDYGYMASTPGIDKTASFILNNFGAQATFNFNDVGEGFVNATEIFYLAGKYNNPGVAQSMRDIIDTYNMTPDPLLLVWYKPEYAKSDQINMDLDGLFKGVEMATFRNVFNDRQATYAAIHAGPNDVSHSHLGVGNFVFDSQGIRWFSDLGMDDYNLDGYFETETRRWNFYRLRAEGHNTIVIDPTSGPDQQIHSIGDIIEFDSKKQGGYAVVDMKAAYGEVAKDVKRGLMLTDERRSMVVRDEIELTRRAPVYWFAHTRADIEIQPDKKSAILTLGNKQLYAKLDSNAADAAFTVMDAAPLPTSPNPAGQNPNDGYKKLAIELRNVKSAYINVMFTPMVDGAVMEDTEFVNEPLSNWKNCLSDEEIVKPAAEEIKVDGKVLGDFKAEKLSYTVELDFGTLDIPQVEASATDAYTMTVKQAETLPGTAEVTVVSKENPKKRTTYSILMKIMPLIDELPQDAQEVKIKGISASEVPQPENPPEGAIDGDLGTRWSAEGVQWLMADLGEEKDILYVGLSWLSGDVRISTYSIDVSTDGENFTTIYSSESSGLTSKLEINQIPVTKARYVRINGFGNTDNQWNSICEFKIYTGK